MFHTVADGAQIIQTFEFEGAPGQVRLESTTFEDLNGRTRLRNHAVFGSAEARDTALANGMEQGIVESMDRLDELTSEPGRRGR